MQKKKHFVIFAFDHSIITSFTNCHLNKTKDDINHESYLHVLTQLYQHLYVSSLDCHTRQTKHRNLLDKEMTHRLHSSNSNTLHAASDVPHQTAVGILSSKELVISVTNEIRQILPVSFPKTLSVPESALSIWGRSSLQI